MRGTFDVQRMLVILDGGREVSPTEFERLAGKAASKKWKASIRVDKVCPKACHVLLTAFCRYIFNDILLHLLFLVHSSAHFLDAMLGVWQANSSLTVL